jgi:hypothetical protein
MTSTDAITPCYGLHDGRYAAAANAMAAGLVNAATVMPPATTQTKKALQD